MYSLNSEEQIKASDMIWQPAHVKQIHKVIPHAGKSTAHNLTATANNLVATPTEFVLLYSTTDFFHC